MYFSVSVCIFRYLYDPIYCPRITQNGLCPIGRADYSKHPLTSGQKPVYSARIQSFHLAVAHLRCFDARLTRRDRSIIFNFWDRDCDFIKGVRRVPPYTDLFWAMFYKIAPFLGGMKKLILDAKTPEDVEEIRKTTVCVSIPDEHNEGEFRTTEVPLLSNEVRAMIDNMLFVACYSLHEPES